MSSSLDFSGSGTNQDMDQYQGPVLLIYLSILLKLISTIVVVLLSIWVLFTIKTTQSLHKPHNIFAVGGWLDGCTIGLFDC